MATANMKAEFKTDIARIWEVVTSCTEFTITVFEPYKRYEFDMNNDNMQGHWSGVFSEENGVVTIDFTEEVYAKKLVMKPFVGMYLKKQQAAYLADLKKVLGE